MLEESKRQAYLSAMGVTQWQSRFTEEEQQAPAVTQSVEPAIETRNESQQQSLPEQPIEAIESQTKPNKVEGLRLLNQASKNGLLVILSEQRKDLSSESRMLISKMLKAIHFLPAETGFAVISEQDDSSSEVVSLESIKAILVLGFEAGRQLVKVAGARVIPGTETYTLNDCKVVVSWHPDELHDKPEYKQQAWNDLKQLVNFFKTP